MTDHRDDVITALHRLRTDVRQQVPAPPSAALRRTATRQLRVRRTAYGVLAAAAVAAIAVGGATVLQPVAGPPVPPAESPTPAPTQAPEPAPGLPTDPPSPSPQQPPPEPFTDVDWREVTIALPPHERCPDGVITFVPVSDFYPSATGPADSYPRALLDANNAAYGDLTGDGRAEAIVRATCISSEEGSGDGEGQLLVIARDPDGALRAIAWVGPRGAIYHGAWVSDGALYMEAQPWHVGFEWALGVALRYEWDGTGFGGYTWAPEYPPILPPDEAETGPPVRLGPVADGLDCPDGTVQFGRDATATLAGATYDLTQPTMPSSGPHLLGLGRTAELLLVAAISCTHAGQTSQGLAVFLPGGQGLDGVALLTVPYPWQIAGWQVDPWSLHPHVLRVEVYTEGGAPSSEAWYRWTGDRFEPVE